MYVPLTRTSGKIGRWLRVLQTRRMYADVGTVATAERIAAGFFLSGVTGSLARVTPRFFRRGV